MGKDVGKLESSYTAGRKGAVTLENSLASLFFHCTLCLIPLVHLLHHCVISIKLYVGFGGRFVVL